MITFLAIASAIAILLWPSAQKAEKLLPSLDLSEPVVVPNTLPSYQSAISSLADVRTRLAKTEQLGEAESKAINTITLALVAGSDVK